MATTRSDLDQRAEETVLGLIDDRGPGKTICPSDAARALAGDDDFRPYMDPVRDVAARLADEDRIEVTQKGEPVTIGEARGPIRLGQKEAKRRAALRQGPPDLPRALHRPLP